MGFILMRRKRYNQATPNKKRRNPPRKKRSDWKFVEREGHEKKGKGGRKGGRQERGHPILLLFRPVRCRNVRS
jgi:hypothetical protein